MREQCKQIKVKEQEQRTKTDKKTTKEKKRH